MTTEKLDEVEDPGKALRSFILRMTRREPPAPTRMVTGTSPASRTSGDWKVAALGLTLALTCALFPWYIFFNQEQFGVRALEFSGQGTTGDAVAFSAQPQRIGAPISAEEVPISQLDLFSTGTVGNETGVTVSAADQPFPADLVEYRLVHVANGRAMIEDADGIWIVQVGSVLPDSSRVASIEKRDGNWAIVTSSDRVVAIAQ